MKRKNGFYAQLFLCMLYACLSAFNIIHLREKKSDSIRLNSIEFDCISIWFICHIPFCLAVNDVRLHFVTFFFFRLMMMNSFQLMRDLIKWSDIKTTWAICMRQPIHMCIVQNCGFNYITHALQMHWSLHLHIILLSLFELFIWLFHHTLDTLRFNRTQVSFVYVLVKCVPLRLCCRLLFIKQ